MWTNINILGWDYFLLIFFLWSMSFFCYQLQHNYGSSKAFKGRHSPDVLILRIAFLVLGLMAAFRGLDVANDTMAYYSAYHYFKTVGHFVSAHMEVGYVTLNLLLAKIFPEGDVGFHILVFFSAIFCYFSVEQWIEKHAKTYGICLLVFYFLLNSFFISAIRQAIAISIILIALTFLEKRRKIYFILGVFLASCFHITALVSFSFLLFYNRRFNYKWAIITGILAILIVCSNLQQTIFLWLIPNTVYVFGEIGNLSNVLALSSFYLVMLLLGVLALKPSQQPFREGKFADDFFAFCITITLAITILSVKGPILDRVGHYFSFAGLPYIANVMYRIPNQKFANLIKIFFCMVLWAYSVASLILRPEWNHLWPYHFFWN